MLLLIDDANIEAIRELCGYFPVDGVTTNPSILAANRREPYAVLEEIRQLIGPDKQLHVQVTSQTAEDMVAEGLEILRRLGKTTYVKVPVTREGLKAIRLLKEQGCRITATAIYTTMQAYLAAKAGADFAAPYVNRIDNQGFDGVDTVRAMQDIFDSHGFTTQILAASFKNSRQVMDLCQYGIGAATVSPDVMESLVKNDSVAAAVEKFSRDFQRLCGEGKTMLDA